MTQELIGTGLLSRRDQLRVLIAGTHRSGTSWMGNILLNHEGTREIYEPFSKLVGIKSIKHWFPLGSKQISPYYQVVESFFKDRIERLRLFIPQSSLSGTINSFIDANRRRLVYNEALRNPPERLIIKDPLASMLAEHVISRFGFKVIFLVKHPFAFYDSLMRVGWHTTLPIQDLLNQCENIFDDFGFIKSIDYPTQAAAIWSLVNAEAIRLDIKYPGKVKIVRHEDLCRGFHDVMNDVATFLNISYSLEMRRYVESTSIASSVMPKSQIIHEFDRNTAALPDRWKETVNSHDREVLFRGTRVTCEALYPEVKPLTHGA